MKRCATALLLLLVLKADAEDIRTLDGHTYRNARITRTDAVGVNILHSSGACYVPYTNLAESIRSAYHYDPAAAAAYEAAKQTAAEERELAAQRQRDAEAARRTALLAASAAAGNSSHTEPQSAKATPKPPATTGQRDYSAVDYSSRSYDTGRVYVRGYYRKDGTYVRPHTRRR